MWAAITWPKWALSDEKDTTRAIRNLDTSFIPIHRNIAYHGPAVSADLFFEPDLSLTDREIDLSYTLSWIDRSSLSLSLEEGYVRLLEPFDPTNTGGVKIPAGEEFNWTEAALTYKSNQRQLLTYMVYRAIRRIL